MRTLKFWPKRAEKYHVKSFRTRPAEFGKDTSGFTLPEVMITIVILGILFAIASSTWQSVVEGRQVDSATNQLASDLRLASTRATNRLEDWTVVYTVGSGSYQLVPDGGTAINRTLPEGTKILSTEVAVVGGDSEIVFSTRGQANATYTDGDSDNEIDVVVSSDDGSPSNTIHVVPPTAEVEVG